MDQDQMEQAGPVQCRNGCGFYSNAGTDGLCSVCYKDCIKKKQQPPTNMPASLVPTSMAPSGNGSSSSPPQMTSLSIGDEMANAITSSVPSSSPTLTNSNKSGPISVETGSPTVILPSSSSTLQTEKVSIRNLILDKPQMIQKYLIHLMFVSCKYFNDFSEERVRIGSTRGYRLSFYRKCPWN